MQHLELGECSSVVCPLLPSWSHQGHGFREEEYKDKVPVFSLKIISVCHPWLPLPVLTLVGWQRCCSSGSPLQLPWGRESLQSQSLQCGSKTATPRTLLRSSFQFPPTLGAGSVPQSGLKFIVLLPQSPKCWGFECIPSCLASIKSIPQHRVEDTLVAAAAAAAVFAPMRLTITTGASGCRRLILSTAFLSSDPSSPQSLLPAPLLPFPEWSINRTVHHISFYLQ